MTYYGGNFIFIWIIIIISFIFLFTLPKSVLFSSKCLISMFEFFMSWEITGNLFDIDVQDKCEIENVILAS